jgi:neutral trehalase
MHKLLWSEQDGCWYDYDMGTGSQRTNFHPTNVFPLFVGALATDQDKIDVVSKIVAYLQV